MEYVKIAYFTRNNCKILSIAEDKVHLYRKKKNCVIDPNLDRVRGNEPCFWKHRHGTIIPMTTDERVARWKEICDNGLDNTVEEPTDEMAAHPGLNVSPLLHVKWYVKRHYREILIYTSLGAILGYLI
jgi:hypothetical protein